MIVWQQVYITSAEVHLLFLHGFAKAAAGAAHASSWHQSFRHQIAVGITGKAKGTSMDTIEYQLEQTGVQQLTKPSAPTLPYSALTIFQKSSPNHYEQ